MNRCRCGHSLITKHKRGRPYKVCPRCGSKYETEFSTRLGDRPGAGKVLNKLAQRLR